MRFRFGPLVRLTSGANFAAVVFAIGELVRVKIAGAVDALLKINHVTPPPEQVKQAQAIAHQQTWRGSLAKAVDSPPAIERFPPAVGRFPG
jgi:hypothetical protein